MAQPKRRWSKARTGLRRSTWKLEEKNLAVCNSCGEPVLPHTACPSCGKYNKRQAVVIETKSKKEEKKETK